MPDWNLRCTDDESGPLHFRCVTTACQSVEEDGAHCAHACSVANLPWLHRPDLSVRKFTQNQRSNNDEAARICMRRYEAKKILAVH